MTLQRYWSLVLGWQALRANALHFLGPIPSIATVGRSITVTLAIDSEGSRVGIGFQTGGDTDINSDRFMIVDPSSQRTITKTIPGPTQGGNFHFESYTFAPNSSPNPAGAFSVNGVVVETQSSPSSTSSTTETRTSPSSTSPGTQSPDNSMYEFDNNEWAPALAIGGHCNGSDLMHNPYHFTSILIDQTAEKIK
ncbi:hypothetical protein K435DRAFT_855333 [Dendrothele bispora CBS 962.96]|uniref:Uncharacterized protein n=1 Tax=Dendrothele bispora (strain CBS 962.96) TaxID=1314807 RepID=A0A4S8MBH1_DENBC|nr:hypothetical protein K435DRAFT_855333 [Dendrothele bispora CBS 962.96]